MFRGVNIMYMYNNFDELLLHVHILLFSTNIGNAVLLTIRANGTIRLPSLSYMT